MERSFRTAVIQRYQRVLLLAEKMSEAELQLKLSNKVKSIGQSAIKYRKDKNYDFFA